MADYSQMVAIPRQEYTQLTTVQNVRQPLTEQLYKLENDYQANTLLPDAHRSVLLQSETIEHMKNVKDQMRNYLTVSTPKPYRARAHSLFQSLEPHLNVNELGEVIKDDGSTIKSSRYEDLIQHAVRDRRRQFSPTGWDYFVDLLKKYNVPRASLNRETLEELQGLNKTTKGPQPSKLPQPTKFPLASKLPLPSKLPQPSKLRQPSKIPYPSQKLPKEYFTFPSKSPFLKKTKQTRGRDSEKGRTRTPSKRKKAPPRRFMFEKY